MQSIVWSMVANGGYSVYVWPKGWRNAARRPDRPASGRSSWRRRPPPEPRLSCAPEAGLVLAGYSVGYGVVWLFSTGRSTCGSGVVT